MTFLLSPLVSDAEGCVTCACAALQPPLSARDAAHAVFSGRVVGLLTLPAPELDTTPNDSARHQTVRIYTEYAIEAVQATFDVHRVWKGEVSARAEVFTGLHEGACGFAFAMGGDYLVYARRRPNGRWHTSTCVRTRAASQATSDFGALGPGALPTGTDALAR